MKQQTCMCSRMCVGVCVCDAQHITGNYVAHPMKKMQTHRKGSEQRGKTRLTSQCYATADKLQTEATNI